LLIALEHPLKVDKAATALLTGVICWVLVIYGKDTLFGPAVNISYVEESITFHLGEISAILFFLLAAMTIVELIDAYHGFEVVTSKIRTTSRVKLLWIICLTTFFFSAVLDNLTTTIVIAALLKKLIDDREELWFFAGMVVISANAGGAWSPIGDITTIMLWIGGQITAMNIIKQAFLPSLICLIVPLIVVSFQSKGDIGRPVEDDTEGIKKIPRGRTNLILLVGVLGLLFVPVFKNLTHLPPFMGMLFSLGSIWVLTEIMNREESERRRASLSVSAMITKIDTPSVLFFLGILLAVSSLQTAGHLRLLAVLMDDSFSSLYVINAIIGLLSAFVDNVPLVAGAMGMYSMETYSQDHVFWELLAYCAGTGGSTLIIGSAAGVAIMGILKIDFVWYFKKMSWLAILGYFSGFLVFYLFNG